MDHSTERWRWIEHPVDDIEEHFLLTYADPGRDQQPCRVARVGRGARGVFHVQFLLTGREGCVDLLRAVEQARREIAFYLVEKGEHDPWAYAIHHCGTLANAYSKLRWGYRAAGENRRESSES